MVFRRTHLQLSPDQRRQSYLLGLRAEKIARWLLMLKGYKIIVERYQNAFGEIDIIAKKGDTLVLVEVKARKTFRKCAESITPLKQQKQIKAAKALLAYPGTLAAHVRKPQVHIRFDVVMIVPNRLPRHITNAFGE